MSTLSPLESRMLNTLERARRDVQCIADHLRFDGNIAAAKRLDGVAARIDDEIRDAEIVVERTLDDLAQIARATIGSYL